MAKRKPKPATAGERVVTAWNDHHIGIDDVRDDPESRDLASRIDAAIRRAVRKERERCAKIAICTTDPWVNKYKAINGRSAP